MAYGRRATGRDEMLKRNQQRKKRKAPSNPAPKKETSQATKTKVAFTSDKLAETPKVKPISSKQKTNVLPKIEGQKPKTTTTANRPAPKAPTPPPPVPQAKTSPAPSSPDKKPARQQASTTRSNRNRGMTGYGYTGGRGGSGSSTASSSSSKPKRSNYPAGRAGSAAYVKAMRAYNKKNSGGSSSTNKPKVNRRGRRV